MPKPPEIRLKPGDLAPDFEAPTGDGTSVRLGDFSGRHVLLFFYPKDDTPGCTKEACAFRDSHGDFASQGVVVLGVSVDPVKSHQKFSSKYGLPFALVSDESRKIVGDYGVWGEKVFMGRKYQGTHRVTFLIGPDRRIRHVWTEVKPATHPAEVLALLRNIAN